MRIIGVTAHTYDASYTHGPYTMSRGRVSPSQPSLVVRVDTDAGVTGWAEVCPHGRTYLPSFFEGELAAVAVLAPSILGLDPCNTGRLTAVMDRELLGSNPAKAVLDIACWDIFGKSLGVPAADLLGGRLADTVPLFTALPVDTPERMAAQAERERSTGVRVLQVKVGDDPLLDARRVRGVVEVVGATCTVLADANGGWTVGDALLAAGRLAGLPVHLEQPCRTLGEIAEVSRRTALPIVVDEGVTTMADLVQARQVAGAAGVNLKPSRVGGLTRARALRDAAEALGMRFTVDDTWGGALASAHIAALAATSRPEHLTGVTCFTGFTTPVVASGVGQVADGRLRVPTAPGLGVEVDEALLGDPVFTVGRR